ncbi:glycerophosphodiester phosphodiesterase family protein [Shouchella sp. 1P09AA]|uniref:glycerophosphodiester phosphodiesterase n=1 Tax=unclassified Shouchella TaxID=2893065 RepID=UPI0039A3796F
MERVIAHRGFSSLYPENTLKAFEEAIKCGCQMIEFDVHLSSDYIPVVIHDEKVNRVTNGSGYVKDLSVKALKELYVFESEKIPTLQETLLLLKGRAKPIIELKGLSTNRNLEKNVLESIKKAGMMKEAQLISFDLEKIDFVRELCSDVQLGYIQRRPTTAIFSRMKRNQIGSLTMNYRFFSKRFAKRCGQEKVQLAVYHLSKARQIKRCLRYEHVSVTIKALDKGAAFV